MKTTSYKVKMKISVLYRIALNFTAKPKQLSSSKAGNAKNAKKSLPPKNENESIKVKIF